MTRLRNVLDGSALRKVRNVKAVVSRQDSRSTLEAINPRRRSPRVEVMEISADKTGRYSFWENVDVRSPWLLPPREAGDLHSEALGVAAAELGASADAKRIEMLLDEDVGTPVALSKQEAVELARLLFGSDPSLPEGRDYVEMVRGDWSDRMRR